MAQILIRRLSERLVDALKRRAAAAGRSMEEEARQILAASLAPPAQAHWRRVREHLSRYGERVLPDSADEIRRARDERTRRLSGR